MRIKLNCREGCPANGKTSNYDYDYVHFENQEIFCVFRAQLHTDLYKMKCGECGEDREIIVKNSPENDREDRR